MNEAVEESAPEHRRIRSFVTRAGRISNAQQRALDELSPHFVFPFGAELGDWLAPSAPIVFEIGFGMGETTAAIAKATPDVRFLGIEVHTPGVGALLKQIHESGLQNVRIISHDAVAVLESMIPEQSLSGMHIFFPDPWHKKRHHKRRLIQPTFVSLIASRLKAGGYLHCATDWEDYALQIADVLSQDPSLEAWTGPPRTNPLCERPVTKFEQRGLRLGHGVWDLVYLKRS